MLSHRTHLAVFLGVALVLVLAACGGAAAAPTPTAREPQRSVPTVAAMTPTVASPVKEPPGSATAVAAATPTATQARATAGPTLPPKATGKLVVAITGAGVEPLDPADYKLGSDRPFLSHMYDGLATRDVEARLAPALATSWAATPGGWEFTLRKGVRFQNGDLFDARDVKFSFERYIEPERKTARGAELKRIVSLVEVRDDHRVMFRTPKPFAILGNYFTTQSMSLLPIPKSYVERVGDKGFGEKPLGTGPFKFASRSIGDFIQMEAFEEYWAGSPSIKMLLMRIVPEATTRLAMLKTGEADIIDGVQGRDIAGIEKTSGLRILRTPSAGSTIIHFRDPVLGVTSPFDDKRVRLAISYAIDRQAILDKIWMGEGRVTGVPMLGPAAFGFDPTLKPPPYDPEKARSLLREAGYEQGFDTTVNVPKPTTAMTDTLEAAAAYLRAVGIRAKVEPWEAATLTLKWFAKDKAAKGLMSWGGGYGYYDGAEARHVITSTGPWTAMSHPEVDKLIDEADITLDPKSREELLKKAYRIISEEALLIPMFYHTIVFAVGPKVAEWKLIAGESLVVNLATVRLIK